MAKNPVAAYYRLRKEAIELFRGKWPPVRQFTAFARGPACGGLKGSFEHVYPDLQAGQSVPRTVVHAWAEYAKQRMGMADVTVEGIATPDHFAAREANADEHSWDWSSIYDSIRQFQDVDEMFFADAEKNSLEAARACMRTVGYLFAPPGAAVDEESCIERARPMMGRTEQEYADWIRRMHSLSVWTTIFTVARRRLRSFRTFERVGMASVTPLTQEAFAEVCAGRLAELEIGEQHFQNPSPYIFIHGIAEPDASCRVSAKEVDRGQSRGIFMSLAYFSRDIRKLRPHVVTFGGTPKYEDRLTQMGFRANGNLLKGTDDRPLMILGPPPTLSVNDYWHYFAFMMILKFYRVANRARWKRRDRK